MSSINRHIANNSDGPTEVQHTSYYPFGGIIADLSSGRDVQNRTYNAKEQDFANNLFWLDYCARQYDPTRGQFTNYDQHCESYFSTNPLAYCSNNPISRIDPTGYGMVKQNNIP